MKTLDAKAPAGFPGWQCSMHLARHCCDNDNDRERCPDDPWGGARGWSRQASQGPWPVHLFHWSRWSSRGHRWPGVLTAGRGPARDHQAARRSCGPGTAARA